MFPIRFVLSRRRRRITRKSAQHGVVPLSVVTSRLHACRKALLTANHLLARLRHRPYKSPSQQYLHTQRTLTILVASRPHTGDAAGSGRNTLNNKMDFMCLQLYYGSEGYSERRPHHSHMNTINNLPFAGNSLRDKKTARPSVLGRPTRKCFKVQRSRRCIRKMVRRETTMTA